MEFKTVVFGLCVGTISLMVGIVLGVGSGYRTCSEQMKRIHTEIGIKIVKTTVDDKTTYSYVVVDKKENK